MKGYEIIQTETTWELRHKRYARMYVLGNIIAATICATVLLVGFTAAVVDEVGKARMSFAIPFGIGVLLAIFGLCMIAARVRVLIGRSNRGVTLDVQEQKIDAYGEQAKLSGLNGVAFIVKKWSRIGILPSGGDNEYVNSCDS